MLTSLESIRSSHSLMVEMQNGLATGEGGLTISFTTKHILANTYFFAITFYNFIITIISTGIFNISVAEHN